MTPVSTILPLIGNPPLPTSGSTAQTVVPQVQNLRSIDFSQVTSLLQQGASDGVFPGAVALVGRGGQALYHFAVGKKWVNPPDSIKNDMTRDTVFDLAGVSTVMSTTSLIMKLVEGHQIKLEDRIARYIQQFGVLGKPAITIEQILSHSSGLIGWMPYFEELVQAHAGARIGILTSRGAREYIYNAINRLELKYEPGSKQLYSDLGFILLGCLIEAMLGLRLDKATQKLVFQPLGLKSSSFVELAMIKRRGIHPVRDRIAPTEDCPWRKRVMCGEVHDDNAWAMGGIAGHSGVFSNATDLHTFAAEIIKAYHGQSPFLKRETVRRFFAGPKDIHAHSGYRLGWEAPNKRKQHAR